MEEKRDNKEIRVRLHHIDRGNCTEVWEVQTEKGKPRRYLGRDDGYGPKEWYTLCDAPYGYCERDCHVRRTSPSLSATKIGTRCCETERTGNAFLKVSLHWMKPATRHGARS